MGRCGTAGETVKARPSRRGKGAAVAASFSAAERVNRAAISGVALQVGRDQRLSALLCFFSLSWSWDTWRWLRRQARGHCLAIAAEVIARGGRVGDVGSVAGRVWL
jgi:hypothetical protein